MGLGNLFGRSIIADNRLAGGFLGPDTFAIGFEEPGSDLNLWTYAVINSMLGLQGIQAAAYGTSIPHIRPDLLAAFPVPNAPANVMSSVANLIRTAIAQREVYLQDLTKARHALDQLPEIQEAHGMCARRTRQSVCWTGPFPTLSAWTFASTGGALGYLQSRWRGRLADYVEKDGIFNGLRFARVACKPPNGVDLMSQRDAQLIRAMPRRIALPPLPLEKLFALPGTIMVGSRGTLGEGEIFGRPLLVTKRLSEIVFTEDLLRIVPVASVSEQLYAFLSTVVGFRLLRSTAVGTKILGMRGDLLSQLPIPDLRGATATCIQNYVRTAFAARDSGDQAEAEAIRIIEQEVLPQWLM
jgi:type I restriction enzyme S subunit